jgi:hypothetical protein
MENRFRSGGIGIRNNLVNLGDGNLGDIELLVYREIKS